MTDDERLSKCKAEIYKPGIVPSMSAFNGAWKCQQKEIGIIRKENGKLKLDLKKAQDNNYRYRLPWSLMSYEEKIKAIVDGDKFNQLVDGMKGKDYMNKDLCEDTIDDLVPSWFEQYCVVPFRFFNDAEAPKAIKELIEAFKKELLK